MPFPATHVLVNIALFYPLRKQLGRYWLIFAAFSGLLLDFDFVIGWVLGRFGVNAGFFGHGGFCHSFGFVLMFLAISLIILAKNREYAKYGFILTMGSGIHLLLDFVLGGGAYSLMLFYPLSAETFRLHLLEPYIAYSVFPLLDAALIIILLVWLWYYLQHIHKTPANNKPL